MGPFRTCRGRERSEQRQHCVNLAQFGAQPTDIDNASVHSKITVSEKEAFQRGAISLVMSPVKVTGGDSARISPVSGLIDSSTPCLLSSPTYLDRLTLNRWVSKKKAPTTDFQPATISERQVPERIIPLAVANSPGSSKCIWRSLRQPRSKT